jgi:hypothetical protein
VHLNLLHKVMEYCNVLYILQFSLIAIAVSKERNQSYLKLLWSNERWEGKEPNASLLKDSLCRKGSFGRMTKYGNDLGYIYNKYFGV